MSHINPALRSMPRAIRPNEATRPTQQNSAMILKELSIKQAWMPAGIAAS
jgi:hypothetical protein